LKDENKQYNHINQQFRSSRCEASFVERVKKAIVGRGRDPVFAGNLADVVGP
jgi:hypothetical protein